MSPRAWLSRLSLFRVFVLGLTLGVLARCGAPVIQPDGTGGGTLSNGATCTNDDACRSGFCEVRVGATNKVCAAQGCGECEGVNAQGVCASVTEGAESATCTGGCSDSYAGPSGKRVCCARRCVCSTAVGVCPT